MGKEKPQFDCYVGQENDNKTYFVVESNDYQQGLTIPELHGKSIEELISVVELFKEKVEVLLNVLVEHAQELEDE